MENDIIKKYGVSVLKGITKGGIAAIPYFGNAAIAIYDEVKAKQVERKIKRLEELYNAIGKDLENIEDKINKECVNKDDCLDIFEQMTNRVINERNKEKRTMFKNIFENTITDKDFNFDVTEKYMRILDQLDPLQIRILVILLNPSKYNHEKGDIINVPAYNQYGRFDAVYSVGGVLTQLLNLKDYEVRNAISFLYFNGLIEENLMNKKLQTNSNPINVLNNTLSIFGRKFVSYCLDC